MRHLYLYPINVVILAFACNATYASSTDTGTTDDKLVIRYGDYHVFGMSTRIRVDPSAGPLGTSIGLEQTLNLPDSVTVKRLDGYYLVNDKQRVDVTYYNSYRAGTVTLPTDIIIGDVTMPAGSTTSSADSKTLSAIWSYSFIKDRRYDFGIGGGFSISSDIITLTDDSSPTTTAKENILAPVPVLSFRGSWNISRKWRLAGREEVFLIDLENRSGAITDFTLRIEHQTFRHLGFGFGLTYMASEIETTSSGLDVKLENGFRGAMFYLKGNF